MILPGDPAGAAVARETRAAVCGVTAVTEPAGGPGRAEDPVG